MSPKPKNESAEDKEFARASRMGSAFTEHLLPEAKVVLLAMVWSRLGSATLTQLQEMCNMPLGEVAEAARCLSAARVNDSKSYDLVTLTGRYQP